MAVLPARSCRRPHRSHHGSTRPAEFGGVTARARIGSAAVDAAGIALTTDDLTVNDDGTYLRLGLEPLLLPPPLDALVTSLPIAKPFGAASTLADERWLFPGKWAGHHQHPTSLMGRLNKLGITTRASRSAAMLHLAATVPPAVFASLIGISTGAATRWAEYAGSNWTTYAAIRMKATTGPRQNQ